MITRVALSLYIYILICRPAELDIFSNTAYRRGI